MKRLNTSDDFFSKEEKRSKKAQIYSREFQAMLDGLDRDECGGGEAEEELCGGGGGAAGDKKRRLSSEQVKALEKNFEVENKLEPERKSQLAEELGLQPRQVAIWFQNRRARFKTKQLERDYGFLKADYDSLKLEFDHLEQENEALLAELRQVKRKLNQENADSNMVLCYGAAAKEGDGEDQSPASESVTNAGGVAINGIHIHGVDPIKEDTTTQYEDEDKLLSFQHHNSSSSPLLNWIHFSNNNNNNLSSSSREAAADELGNTEESCNNFFSVVDHAPTLHRYFPQ